MYDAWGRPEDRLGNVCKRADEETDCVAIIEIVYLELCLSAVTKFREMLYEAIEVGEKRRIIVNLSGVTFIDSCALGTIINAYRLMIDIHPSQPRLYLVVNTRPVERFLYATGLNELFPQFKTIEEALGVIMSEEEHKGLEDSDD